MSDEGTMKVVGVDLALDIRVAKYFDDLGKDLDAPRHALTRGEFAGLLLALQQRSVVYISTEN
ncbi:MAG: hypothetical protein E6Q97_06730 [Desulfurellales bacterium]|nr:MAG: hypothetical protein E6Q97_06730 [Desulfurellales bacterium]